MSAVMALTLLAGCAGETPTSNPGADNAPKQGFLAALAGGASGSDKVSGSEKASGTKRVTPPLAKVSLAGGAVVVKGPEGYCLDPHTSSSSAGRGFAVIASCMILSQGKLGYDVPAVIVTVTVGPRGEDGELPSPRALAVAANEPLIGGETRDGLVLVHLGQGGDQQLEGGDTRYWRGAFVQGGRMVGLALYAPRGNAMAGSQGARMLARVKASIVKASPPAKAPAKSSTAPEKVSSSQPTSKKGGALSRLFGG